MSNYIPVTLLFLILSVFAILGLLGVPIDTNFSSNFFIGILSNLFILVLAYFVIDRSLKKGKLKTISLINKRNSDNVLMYLDYFALKLLLHLNVNIPNQLEVVINRQALKQLLEINNRKDWVNILYNQVIVAKNKKEYLTSLESIIKDGASSILRALKEVEPYPDPKVVEIADGLYILSGVALAMATASEFRDEVNKVLPQNHEKMTEEMEAALRKYFISYGAERLFEDMCKKLDCISQLATENRLFIIEP